MGILYNFTRLINKYKSELTAEVPEFGYFDDKGDYVGEEMTPKKIVGAIISHRESKVTRSEGTLTAKDKRLFTLEKISDDLIGTTVKHGGCKYRIEDCLENAEFTGVYAYTLKYISAFEEGEEW